MTSALYVHGAQERRRVNARVCSERVVRSVVQGGGRCVRGRRTWPSLYCSCSLDFSVSLDLFPNKKLKSSAVLTMT